MKKIRLIQLLFLSLFLIGTYLPTQAQKIDTISVYSTSMKKQIKNIIILPASYTQNTQKKYPVAYPLKRMTLYLVLALVLYVLSQETLIANLWLRLSYRTLLILVFVAFIIKKDLPLRSLPFVNRFFK